MVDNSEENDVSTCLNIANKNTQHLTTERVTTNLTTLWQIKCLCHTETKCQTLLKKDN